MRSIRSNISNRRKAYLALSSMIESQLRDAFAEEVARSDLSQSEVARRLNVDRSTVNKRLRGSTNMTIETIADMAWAIGRSVDVKIYDPAEIKTNASQVVSEHCRLFTSDNNANSRPGTTRPEKIDLSMQALAVSGSLK